MFYEGEISDLELELKCGGHSDYGREEISARIKSLKKRLFVKHRFALMVKFNTRSHSVAMFLQRSFALFRCTKFRPIASGN